MSQKHTKIDFNPINIGKLRLKNNLIAAPMAGLSSLPYRILAMEMGCALAISEMASAEGIVRASEKTQHYYHNDEHVRPFGLQLFGSNPDSFVRAIKMLKNQPIDLFDINMGCPVRKVCKKGAGVALMKNPKLIEKIVGAARRVAEKPVTIKIRSGWDDSSINCVEIAKIAEDAGADAITIHARTKKMELKGKANWHLIGEAKSSVKIPVIGNGDVTCRDDAIRMLNETGCDGIMIGRAAVGNPWIFRSILEGHNGPTFEERGKTAIRHFEMLREFFNDHLAVLNMRTILPWYGKGIPGVRHFLSEVNDISDVETLKQKIAEFFSGLRSCTPFEQSKQ